MGEFEPNASERELLTELARTGRSGPMRKRERRTLTEDRDLDLERLLADFPHDLRYPTVDAWLEGFELDPRGYDGNAKAMIGEANWHFRARHEWSYA